MRTFFSSLIIGIFVFLGAGFLSYKYLGQTFEPTTSSDIQTMSLATTSKDGSVKNLPQAQQTSAQKSATGSKQSIAASPTIAKSVSGTVVAPGPLRISVSAAAQTAGKTTLSVKGVLTYTNSARAQNGGLPALSENVVLDQDAQIKLQDMFTRQYFEHVSPTGDGPAELANKVGYAYVIVGENLALGDFESDSALVDAWMNSPGHRANILNKNYTEIGVAVGKGMYEGRSTWLAVQSFGMPRSACPSIDEGLRTTINASNVAIAELRSQLNAKKAQIDATPQGDPSYNVYINEYNSLVPQYNNMVETNRANVENYNSQVRSFNACIGAVSAQTTH